VVGLVFIVGGIVLRRFDRTTPRPSRSTRPS